MTHIRPATIDDVPLLARLAADTFVESHGHSAAPADIAAYKAEKYSEEALRAELADSANRYHLIFDDDEAAGFSKIVFDVPCPGRDETNLAKLERLYLLRRFYEKRLGAALFDFLVDLARKAGQQGIWLYVWTQNERALRFYRKQGFEIVGTHDFVLSPTHSNPNYRMLLLF
ncbi:GNAT family N-acetyltransferase [Flaviaesturariibacter terrae]